MREIDDLADDLMIEREATRAWRDEARRNRAWMRLFMALSLAAVLFGMMMLNALPSASAAPAPRGLVSLSTERAMRAVCPSERAMSRLHCVRWLRVAQCETGDPGDAGVTATSIRRIRWRYDGRSGFDGGLQFSPRTWRGNIGRVPARRLTRSQWIARERGRYRHAYRAPSAVQILAADALRVRPDAGGMGNWPSCGRRWR